MTGKDVSICEVLRNSRNIVVVGISDKPDRDSGRIAVFLKEKGYNVCGVHPVLENVFGIPVYKSILEVPGDIDIVDIFLSGNKIDPIAQDIIARQPKVVWYQLGVYNDEMKTLFEGKSIKVIQDCCIAVESRNCV